MSYHLLLPWPLSHGKDDEINFSTALKQKKMFPTISSLCKAVGISGLALYLVYQLAFNHSNCPSLNLFLSSSSSLSSSSHPTKPDSATNISHLVFGLVGGVDTWKYRRPYIDAWWRPNATIGYLFLDRAPLPEFLPWPSSTSPPFRVQDDYTKLERESRHVAPIMVRMVLAIWETFRESVKLQQSGDGNNTGGGDVRWYVMAFDDSVLFVDNWVDLLAKYDHTKYYYIGAYSETVVSNMLFSFDQGFGGAGIALSYPLVAAMVKDLKGCIARYPYLRSADTIIQFCVDEFGVPLTLHRGIHQIDLLGDISGFLSSHPQAPLLSLHHLDYVDPIFPSMDRFQSTNHLMKAANVDQSRILQQTICYDKQRSWSFSVSWGYSVHIYGRIHPRSMLKRPLETFRPWTNSSMFMFNTRWPCETPTVFYFESIHRRNETKKTKTETITSTPSLIGNENQIVTSYVRAPPLAYPNCLWKSNHSADHISKIQVFSSTTRLKEVERSECCDVIHKAGTNIADVKIRACKDDEIIA